MQITLPDSRAGADGAGAIRIDTDGTRASALAGPIAWIDHADVAGAWSFLRQHFPDDYGISRLRSLLARELHDVQRMANGEVLDAAARKLANRSWRAGRTVTATINVAQEAGRPVMGKAIRSAGGTPRSASAPRPAPAARTQASVAGSATAQRVPAAQAQWPEAADQVAQARTLEAAARSGAPFCELCQMA